MARPKNPAPPWRCTLFGQSKNVPGGWSEEYWIQADTALNAVNLMNQLYPLRAALMSTQYVFTYFRVSDDNIRGDAQIEEISTADGSGLIDAAGAPPEMAALVRFELADRHHAMRFFHGLANNQYDNFFQILPAINGWDASFILLRDFLELNAVVWSKDFNAATYHNRAIITATYGRVREHRVGRPFRLYRGRRVA